MDSSQEIVNIPTCIAIYNRNIFLDFLSFGVVAKGPMSYISLSDVGFAPFDCAMYRENHFKDVDGTLVSEHNAHPMHILFDALRASQGPQTQHFITNEDSLR